MDEGVVVRAYGGFYFVLPATLAGRAVPCRVRGKLKRATGRILVGDRVAFTGPPDAESEGVIEEVYARRLALERPPVANVDQLVAVVSAAAPSPDLLQLDRILALAERLGVAAVVCLNKIDLVPEAEVGELLEPYRAAGYTTVAVSARRGEGVAELGRLLAGRISVLAGHSGVGKTSLANQLIPGRQRVTGEISRRLGQGRHTTRHAELLVLPEGGLLADTPGFSVLEDVVLSPEEVAGLYPEYATLAKACRFRGCLHDQEPECAVKRAVAEGRAFPGRYRSYLVLLREARERRPWETKEERPK